MNTELAALKLDIKCFAVVILAPTVQSVAPFLPLNTDSKFILHSVTDSFVFYEKIAV